VAGAAAKDPRPSRGQRKDMSSTGSATSTKTIRYVCVTTKQYKSQSALKSELKQIIQINACSKPGAWGMKLLSKMGIYIYLRLRRSKPTRSSNTAPRNRISSSSSAVGKPRTSPSIGYN
jgi:hypothetical protein